MGLNCLIVWILAFISGSILGFFTDYFVIPWSVNYFFLFSLIQVLSFKSRWKIFVVLAGGFFWGASHSAPSVTKSVQNSSIAQRNFFPSGSAVLVRAENGYFFAAGGGELNQNGKLYVFPQAIWSLSRNSRFKPKAPLQTESWCGKLSRQMDVFFQTRIAKIPEDLRAFNSSLLLGKKEDLGKLKETFKKLGLFHLLVVSGLHVSFISWAILCLVFTPFQVLYSLCLLSPNVWFVLKSCLRLLSIIFVVLYAIGIGFPSSTQRAVLLFICDQMTQIFGVSFAIKKRLLWALVLQSFLFPIDFLMVGSFLSWMTYLGVYALVKGPNTFYRVLESQIALTLLIAGILGQLSIIGIFANLLVVPLMPLVFSCVVLQIFPELIGSFLARFADLFERAFLNFVDYLALIVERCDFLYFEFQDWFLLRAVCFSVAAFFLARLWRPFWELAILKAKSPI